MSRYVDRAKVYCLSTGTTNKLTLSSALVGYQAFAAAGVLSGDVLEFLIEDGSAWEISTGIFNASGNSLTRSLRSSSTGALLSLSGNEVISLPLTAISFKAAFSNLGRNLILNARFLVNQRNFSSTAANAIYTFDHWLTAVSSDTITFSSVNLGDSDRTAIGDEFASTAIQLACTGNSGATAYSSLRQAIEGVRRTSGKTLTLSFWAKGNGTLNLGVNAYQNFGTGGSPSATTYIAAATLAITTSWARYSYTFTAPSASGKTLGTARDALWVSFNTSSGATNATQQGVGVQSATVQIWGAQLEVGQVATPLESTDLAVDLERCQRYYIYLTSCMCTGYGTAGTTFYTEQILPTQMRAAPTAAVVSGTTSASNAAATPTVANATVSIVRLQSSTTAAGVGYCITDLTLLAEMA